MKGKLYPWYYVWCAICEYEMPVGRHNRESSVAQLKKDGWKLTRKHGYVCKDCATKAAENK